jgi:hypothetical protein
MKRRLGTLPLLLGLSAPVIPKVRWPRIVHRISPLSISLLDFRQILELLEHSDVVKDKYKSLILAFAVERERLTEESWLNTWRNTVLEIAESMSEAPLNGPAIEAFLTWEDHPASNSSAVAGPSISKDNIYRYSQSGPQVSIQLGSIHSVKGQTHTATLVLETFWKFHNLEKLAPWVLGERVGCKAI